MKCSNCGWLISDVGQTLCTTCYLNSRQCVKVAKDYGTHVHTLETVPSDLPAKLYCISQTVMPDGLVLQGIGGEFSRGMFAQWLATLKYEGYTEVSK